VKGRLKFHGDMGGSRTRCGRALRVGAAGVGATVGERSCSAQELQKGREDEAATRRAGLERQERAAPDQLGCAC
jgi:hypothetical protein